MDMIRKLNKWYCIIPLGIVFTICTIFYTNASAYISEDMGLLQAADFLFNHTKDYGVCLICGLIAKIIVLIMTVIVFVSTCDLIFEMRDRDYNEEYRIRIHIAQFVAKVIILIAEFYFQIKIIHNYFVLLLLAFLILAIIWILCKNKA